MTERTKKLLIKDFNFPFQFVSNDHFDYCVELFDNYCGTKRKLNYAEQAIVKLGENEFIKLHATLSQEIIHDIKQNENYKVWVENPNSIIIPNLKPINLYQIENCGKQYVSIDLVTANFQVLTKIELLLGSPNVLTESSYEQFIKKYTDLDYFIKAKRYRQVIFGNLNPKKQTHYQKVMIKNIADQLTDFNILTSSHDELIIELGNHKLSQIIKLIPPEYIVRVEQFELKQIKNHKFYVKEFVNGRKELKKIPKHLFPQVYKHIHNLKIEDIDKQFEFEGQPALLINNLFENN